MTSSIFYPTPWTLDEIRPELHVYRRGTTECLIIPYTMTPEDATTLLEQYHFLSTSRITFLVHGFRNNVQIPWMHDMKDALLKECDQTVILVDWGNGADLMAARYLQAAANIQSVATWLSTHIVELHKRKKDLPLWGVGHSLGCHLLGLAGRESKALDRISGMDPAGPAFEKHEFLPFRLCATDAALVDVMHTDGYDSFLDPEDWISPVNHYGTLIPLGTLDFYPNYGYDQPGAGPVSSHLIAASHLRAIDLYLWSISNPGRFRTNQILDGTPAFESPITSVKEADESSEMGYHAFKSTAAGYYYIKTSKSEPWVNGAPNQEEAEGQGQDGSSADESPNPSPSESETGNQEDTSRGFCAIM